jgi:hypothetical protein
LGLRKFSPVYKYWAQRLAFTFHEINFPAEMLQFGS